MYSHLVTIEVGVERCTYEWVKLYSLTFYKDWLECLNTKSVECRRTVKHNRVLLDNILKYIPDLCLKLLYHLLSILYIMCCSIRNKLLHNERLEKLNSHLLWKTTLINLKLRSNNDNRTS